MAGREKNIEEDANDVAEESAGRTARDKRLDGTVTQPFSERDCHRETEYCKYKSHQ